MGEMPTADVRTTMIRGAAELLAAQGLRGTSLNDVLTHTGSPRGSINHHFPGGKDELLTEALGLVGRRLERAMTSGPPLRTPQDVAARFVELWRASLVESHTTARCPVAAISHDPPSEQVLFAAREVFRRWREVLAEQLRSTGLESERAFGQAAALVALVEGAVMLARTEQSLELFDVIARSAARLVAP